MKKNKLSLLLFVISALSISSCKGSGTSSSLTTNNSTSNTSKVNSDSNVTSNISSSTSTISSTSSATNANSTTSSSFIMSSSSSNEYGQYTSSIGNPEVTEGENFAPYEIYPIPQNIEYENENFVLPYKMDVVFEDDIDQSTKNHLYNSLAKKNVYVSNKTSISDNPQILVGIYNSNDAVDNYVKNLEGQQDDLFNNFDSYYLSVKDNKIVVLGKDTDACFYGITTLSNIFNQTYRTISNFEIYDYSDSKYRGFIEGYYGIPWTKDERVDLMEFASQFKSNIYIYAPKDDAYHSSNWRGLYTETDLLDLKEQIAAGERTKTRFAWSIHPFISNPITNSNYDEGVSAIINKFEQLYSAGVRQFVVSADDISATTEQTQEIATVHNKVLNDVNEWCLQKGDCYDLIFVPAAYHLHASDGLGIDLNLYFQYLCEGLDENVQIMWTGNSVCSSVSNGKFDEFIELSGRTPFMWMNWPVTDYSESHLLMGKAEVLDAKFEEGEKPNFTGIVTNPMQQPEQSKLSIFAVADYCWNINSFDVDKSYQDSMKYVEEGATEAFYNLCKHLSNASLFEGRWFEESEEFKPFIQNFETQYEYGNKNSISFMISLYQEIVDDADFYLKNAKNIKLRDSIKPWINSLSLLAEASILYLKVLNGGSNEEVGLWFDEAELKVKQMEECKTPILNKVDYGTNYLTVKVGASVLLPFLNVLRSLAFDEAYLSTGRYSGVSYRGFEGIYDGNVENIIDGNDETFCWFNGHPSDSAYIRVDLGEVQEIRDIRVLQGQAQGRDCMYGNVEVSTDGRNFTKVGELSKETIIDLRLNPVTARYIRLTNVGTETWVAIKEVQVNVLDNYAGIVTIENINLEASVETNLNNMIDGDMNTYTWFDINRNENATITLDMLEVKEINNVYLYMSKETSPSDYFHNYSISISKDGVNYESLGEFNVAELELALDSTKEARYLRITALETDPYGIVIREFYAN